MRLFVAVQLFGVFNEADNDHHRGADEASEEQNFKKADAEGGDMHGTILAPFRICGVLCAVSANSGCGYAETQVHGLHSAQDAARFVEIVGGGWCFGRIAGVAFSAGRADAALA